MMFSSGKHEKITADPTPWVHDCGDAGCDIAGKHYADRTDTDTLAGRPEFDRPLTNPANPILAELRGQPETLEIGVLHAFDEANSAAWVKAGEPYDGPFSEWWQFETHAMRVIERLATE